MYLLQLGVSVGLQSDRDKQPIQSQQHWIVVVRVAAISDPRGYKLVVRKGKTQVGKLWFDHSKPNILKKGPG